MHIEVHAKYFVHIIKQIIHYNIKRVNLELHLSSNLSIQKNIEKKSRNDVKQ